jgi:hypothetical protein
MTVCAIIIAVLILLFSVRPNGEKRETLGFKTEKVWSKVTLSTEANAYKARLEKVDITKSKVSE